MKDKKFIGELDSDILDMPRPIYTISKSLDESYWRLWGMEPPSYDDMANEVFKSMHMDSKYNYRSHHIMRKIANENPELLIYKSPYLAMGRQMPGPLRAKILERLIVNAIRKDVETTFKNNYSQTASFKYDDYLYQKYDREAYRAIIDINSNPGIIKNDCSF